MNGSLFSDELSLLCPISRDTFFSEVGSSPNGATPPLLLSFTQAHLCDTPFCNIASDKLLLTKIEV